MSMPENYRQNLIRELQFQAKATQAALDVIVVAHNQYHCLSLCLESIAKYTKNYRLFVWDNASNSAVASLIKFYNPHVLGTADTNWGFVKPNNYLAALTTAPYIALVNSDAVVCPGWDEAMIGYLEENKDCGVVGYEGGLLDENGFGIKSGWGEEIDYVCGWSMCVPRSVYEKTGLFDPSIKFAYCEDSEFSLRLKSLGYKIYALHLAYAKHKGGATIKEIVKTKDMSQTFSENHRYLKNKWGNYLDNERIMATTIL